MIVCLCRRVSDRDIHRAVQQGVHDFELLQDETGVAGNCGCCHDCAREVFDEALSKCGRGCGGPQAHAIVSVAVAAG